VPDAAMVGRVKRGRDVRLGSVRTSAPDLVTLRNNSPLMMSIAHGIRTLGVVGAGQMGMFSSFAVLSTSLPAV
jgi:hypothetical protein